MHALLAVGVNADGYREILGLHVTSAEDGAGWLVFFRDLAARGPSGVALVTSDAHRGLVDAIGATLPRAAWQRCRTHYTANLMAATPRSAWAGSKLCCTASTTSPTPRPCMPSSPTTPRNGSTGRSAAPPTLPASSHTRAALVRLVGTVLAEQHDEWTEQRRCLGLDILAKSRLTKITNESQIDKEVTITAITAKSEDHAEASFKHHSSGRDRDEAAQA